MSNKQTMAVVYPVIKGAEHRAKILQRVRFLENFYGSEPRVIHKREYENLSSPVDSIDGELPSRAEMIYWMLNRDHDTTRFSFGEACVFPDYAKTYFDLYKLHNLSGREKLDPQTFTELKLWADEAERQIQIDRKNGYENNDERKGFEFQYANAFDFNKEIVRDQKMLDLLIENGISVTRAELQVLSFCCENIDEVIAFMQMEEFEQCVEKEKHRMKLYERYYEEPEEVDRMME